MCFRLRDESGASEVEDGLSEGVRAFEVGPVAAAVEDAQLRVGNRRREGFAALDGDDAVFGAP